MIQPLSRRLIAEAFGTFWLVFGGCGAAVLAAAFPKTGIGFAGVALAFGLTAADRRVRAGPHFGRSLQPGGFGRHVAGTASPRARCDSVYRRASRRCNCGSGRAIRYRLGSIRLGARTVCEQRLRRSFWPGGYNMTSAPLIEFVLTFGFIWVIAGSTHKLAPTGFAGIAIGLALTLIHLIAIPVDNTSVNPARSTGPALFAGPEELS